MEISIVLLIIVAIAVVFITSPFGWRLCLFSKMAYLHYRKRRREARDFWKSQSFQDQVFPLFKDSIFIEEMSPYLAYLAKLRNMAITKFGLSPEEVIEFNELIFEWFLADSIFNPITRSQLNQKTPKHELAFESLKTEWFRHFNIDPTDYS